MNEIADAIRAMSDLSMENDTAILNLLKVTIERVLEQENEIKAIQQKLNLLISMTRNTNDGLSNY